MEARECSVAYDSNRRSELRKHRWNFSIKRTILAPDAVAPSFDFAYAFTLPSDCLRVLLPADPLCDWVLEGRKILTNASDVLNLRYVADITDVTQWDASFYDATAISTAIDICERLTNSATKKATLDREYESAIAQAKRMNAFERIPTFPVDDSLWLVRL